MSKSKMFFPPKYPNEAFDNDRVTVFLGGSISKNSGNETRAMGDAENWQKALAEELSDLPVSWLNPRRKQWSPNVKMEADDEEFREQVTWELEMQEAADIKVYYFDAEAKAPIVLMELGAFGFDFASHVIVYCPEGFWRKGNVDIFCERYHIPCFSDRAEFVAALRELIETI